MVKSMTGYGSSIKSNDRYEIKTEIRSVNSRYLDISIKGPRSIIFLENKINKLISSKVKRGSINIFVNMDFIGDYDIDYTLDTTLLNFYLKSISHISEETGFSKDINVLDLLKFDKNLLSINNPELNNDNEFIEIFIESISSALDSLLEMKAVEGYNMKTRINENLSSMQKSLNKIEEYTEDLVKENVSALKSRITSILQEEDIPLSEDKLTNEIVFLSDKLTIDEEITRLNSHIQLMIDELNNKDSSGKKLDFIAQEMIREANTIGSKSAKIEITNLVIKIKENIENIREQVQNIE